jgi:hypothetical protein
VQILVDGADTVHTAVSQAIRSHGVVALLQGDSVERYYINSSIDAWRKAPEEMESATTVLLATEDAGGSWAVTTADEKWHVFRRNARPEWAVLDDQSSLIIEDDDF